MVFPSRSVESGCKLQGRIYDGQVSVDQEESGWNAEYMSPKRNFQIDGDNILKENEYYPGIRLLKHTIRYGTHLIQ